MQEGKEIQRAEGRSIRCKTVITISIIPVANTSNAIIDTVIVPVSPENLLCNPGAISQLRDH